MEMTSSGRDCADEHPGLVDDRERHEVVLVDELLDALAALRDRHGHHVVLAGQGLSSAVWSTSNRRPTGRRR